MKKLILSIVFLYLSLIAMAQDVSLSGSYYAPAKKEVLVIKFNKAKGYIDKIMHGKGTGKLATMQIMSQKGDMKNFTYSFKFYNPAKPSIVYACEVGISPGGIGINTVINKDENNAYFFSEIQNGEYEIESAKTMSVPFFVRNVFWRGFKNEQNNATIIAEDSQEGTAEGQLYLKYTDPAGQEEYVVGKVNPITHQLTFTSKNMGTSVRCELDNEMRWVMRVFNTQTKSKIGDFYQIFK